MDLTEQFIKMREKRGREYKPRTKHLDDNGWAKYTNRLFLESSPYLLQHAHNPVDWYPWGDEAFNTAKEKNLPILLSVGYSTCHWCHVMEEESFEDVEIASFINENYVAIKVDREERPDVDSVYMSAVQALTGQGGWPMTAFLTPERKPFFAGTYFPARDGDRGSVMGFLTILEKIKNNYDENPDLIKKTGENVTSAVQKMFTHRKGNKKPSEFLVKSAMDKIKNLYDNINGGIKGAPKFPSTLPIRLLLKYYKRTQDKTALKMAEQTLVKMAQGGIYDQIGGGFHRYATDERWLVPHFEKMLYDNALLVMAYLEGFLATENKLFKQIIEETLLYVQREMTSPSGGFYSATDADSLTPEGKSSEGYYFTWTPEELTEALGKKDADIVSSYYNVSSQGNFEGRNILNVKESIQDAAIRTGISENILVDTVLKAKTELYIKRQKRIPPLRDEKILTSWNGLMISAFAKSSHKLNNPEYIRTARKAAGFILDNLYIDHILIKSCKDDIMGKKAFLDDYAFFIAGLLDLFEADQDSKWLNTATALDQYLHDHFEDRREGGFFMVSDLHEALIAKEKPGYDGAVPSGNAVCVMNLLKLHRLTGNRFYKKRADAACTAFSDALESSPLGLSEMITALESDII